jgi:hypothetical protein
LFRADYVVTENHVVVRDDVAAVGAAARSTAFRPDDPAIAAADTKIKIANRLSAFAIFIRPRRIEPER